MKRLLTATMVATLALVGSASIAGAANQPSQGEHSTGRNDAGFGGGPHCHVLVANDAAPFTIRLFPSHTGHMHAGNDIFNADLGCDGDAS